MKVLSADLQIQNPKGTPAGTGCPSATSARDRGFLSKIASETNCISELGSFERSCLKRVSKEKNHTGRFPVSTLTLAPCFTHRNMCAHPHVIMHIPKHIYHKHSKKKKVRSLSILLNSIKKNLQVNPLNSIE